MTGHIHATHVTLLNLYGPNFDSPAFFQQIFYLLPSLADTHVILGGNFNCVLDKHLDRSTQTSQLFNASTVLNNNMLSSTNLLMFGDCVTPLVEITLVFHKCTNRTPE